MEIRLVEQPMARSELVAFAKRQFGDFTKAVVDLEREMMAIGGELHADEEAYLLEHGSSQADVWGINLYPEQADDHWIEFDSMINIRPSQGNRSRDVENSKIRDRIRTVVRKLITDES